jgi:hypothetical protein
MASALLKMWLKIILNPKGPANNGMKRQRATGRRMTPLRAAAPLGGLKSYSLRISAYLLLNLAVEVTHICKMP